MSHTLEERCRQLIIQRKFEEFTKKEEEQEIKPSEEELEIQRRNYKINK